MRSASPTPAPAPAPRRTGTRAAAMAPAARRAAIIAAVRPLLAAHGDHVTTRQIAEAAGVAEGTIFGVFTDKDELLLATVEAALDPAPFELGVRAIAADLPLDHRLIVATELLQRRVDEISRLVSGLGPSLRDRVARPLGVSPALVEMFEGVRDRLRVEPAKAAGMLRAITLSLTHPMMATDPMSAADIVDIVLRGIERPDVTPPADRSES